MYVKIEPSGCCERKGMVQIRFAMYLDKTDYGYDKTHILTPVISDEVYDGEVDKNGRPVKFEEFDKWVKSLPTEWQNVPFHNHLIMIEAGATDTEIMDIGEAFLHEAYIKWACDSPLDLKNDALPKTLCSKQDIDAKLASITKAQQIRRIK